MNTNIQNIACIAAVRSYLHAISNTYATFKAQFIKKLSNTDAELKNLVKVSNKDTRRTSMSFWCLYC